MAQVGYGPLQFVDGPLPQPPRYSLLGSSRQPPASGDRWLNGTSAWQYTEARMGLFDPCANAGSSGAAKAAGLHDNQRTDQGTITQWLSESCDTRTVTDQGAYRDRAARIYAAREGFGVELEFLHGALIPDNPHVTDANLTVLNPGAPTNPIQGLALLEEAIAGSKEAGVIHCTPRLLTLWAAAIGGYFQVENGKLISPNGNIVVPGFGYDGLGKDGSAAPGGTKEYAYATGPVEIRMSDITMLPDDVSQALDRKQNTITYYAERYYNIVWSRLVQAAVLIDRCQVGCAA